MKKKTVIFLIIVLAAMLSFGCSDGKYNGNYVYYEINDATLSRYYSMTLRNGSFRLEDIKIAFSVKTVTPITNGKYSIEENNRLVFTASGGTTFTGEIGNGVLTFTYNYQNFYLTRQ